MDPVVKSIIGCVFGMTVAQLIFSLRVISKNTIAITKLEVHMEHLKTAIEDVPKIKTDLNVLHEKIRDLQ